jgi:hypothetical protein
VTAHSNDADSGQLLRLSEEVTRIAGALAALSITSASSSPAQRTGSAVIDNDKERVVSLESVRWLIKARRSRARYLPDELFADPAWDILLDLLHAELTQHRVPVSSLCIAAGVPATTGLRYINSMVEQSLLVRRPDPRDGRRVFIELAPDVSTSLRRYFADVVQPGRKAG